MEIGLYIFFRNCMHVSFWDKTTCNYVVWDNFGNTERIVTPLQVHTHLFEDKSTVSTAVLENVRVEKGVLNPLRSARDNVFRTKLLGISVGVIFRSSKRVITCFEVHTLFWGGTK